MESCLHYGPWTVPLGRTTLRNAQVSLPGSAGEDAADFRGVGNPYDGAGTPKQNTGWRPSWQSSRGQVPDPLVVSDAGDSSGFTRSSEGVILKLYPKHVSCVTRGAQSEVVRFS